MASTETVLPAKDKVKSEMTIELEDRFGTYAKQLYKLFGMLMDKDTSPEELHAPVETLYPDFVKVTSHFEVLRHISAWNKAELTAGVCTSLSMQCEGFTKAVFHSDD